MSKESKKAQPGQKIPKEQKRVFRKQMKRTHPGNGKKK